MLTLQRTTQIAKVTLSPLQAGYRSSTALNANLDAIETALENTLSRDGTSPNQMEAVLDMNNNRIINLPAPVAASDAARFVDLYGVTPGTGVNTFLVTPTSANLAAAVTDETGTGLLVFNTSPALTTPVITGGSFTGGTDIAVADGGTGASTAANARTNLGLAIGTDVQAYDADLAALAANSTDGFWAHTGAGTGTSRTLTGTADQVNITNGAGIAGNPVISLLGNTLALSGLTGAADKLAYFTGSAAMAVTNLVSQARSFLADPSAAFVNFLQTGTGAVARTVQNKLTEVVSATDFGVSTTASAADNLANFKLAIAACPVGGIVDVPPHADPYIINTSGGLTTCIEVNKRITIRLRGDVKASHSAIQANPMYIFNFTAAGSGIEGPGRVIGDGTVFDLSDGSTTAETIPGLVRLNANNTFCRGVTFMTPPQVGLMLYSCYGSDVSGNRFTGGVTSYHSAAAASQTAHFGVYAAGGGRNSYCDNWFYPDAGGGMVIQCFFSNGSNHNNIVSRNYAYRPYEKLLYWYGDSNHVSDNYVFGNTGTIPGTNSQGTIGAVIRVYGANNRIEDNYTADCGAGISVWDGVGNKVINNTLLRCGSAGIGVLGTTTGLTGTRVDGNRVTQAALVGHIIADGIEVTCSHATASTMISVCDNASSGFSVTDSIANVPVWQATTAYNKISTVKPTAGNGRIYDPLSTTTGGTTGGVEPTWPTTPGDTVVDGTVTWVARAYGSIRNEIRVTGNASGKISSSIVSGNNVNGRRAIALEHVDNSTAAFSEISASEYHMMEDTCTAIRWLFNTARGAGLTTVYNMAGSSVFAAGAAVTGTGSLVQATSPTLTTPNIGAATGTSLSLTGGNVTFDTATIRSIGWGGNVSAAAANPLLYSDGNYCVMNSKAGSHLYLNFDNANAASTVNIFNGKMIVQQTGAVSIYGALTVGSAAALVTTSVALNDGAAAAVGTLLNAPAAGNPTKWIPINDNGTTRYIPAW